MAVVRAADRNDLPAITAIYDEAVRSLTATFEIDPPGLAEMTRRFEALEAGAYPCLVACGAEGVLGYAYAGPYRPRPAYRFTVENSVYVDPRFHGLGIGRALLAALIEDCTARGFRQMLAVIGDSQNTASIALHAQAGFAHIGTFRAVGWKFDRWLDTVLMQRTLDGAAEDAV
jgi:phosphinothricin acetyltransferase